MPDEGFQQTFASYPTEFVNCDRCDGMGEVEDDLWVWTRCYSCWGRGTIEVCAYPAHHRNGRTAVNGEVLNDPA